MLFSGGSVQKRAGHLFCRRIEGETGQPAPVCLCKPIGNLEQLLNDARAVRIALGSNVRQHVRYAPKAEVF